MEAWKIWRHMRIGEIAQQVEVSASIIRHYEDLGLLPQPGRNSLGYRAYDEADLERIRLVVGARELGISLADIKDILAIYDNAEVPSQHIIDLLSERVANAEQHSHRLESVKRELCQLRDLALKLAQFDPAPIGPDVLQSVE
jgi:MerR family transcriptional regulator, copper efflux regulator